MSFVVGGQRKGGEEFEGLIVLFKYFECLVFKFSRICIVFEP